MIYLIAIFAYLFVLAGIGIYKSRQVKTQEDFTVAGRTLSPWIMVCTMLAVWIGTGSIVGNAGKTYEVGMAALFLPLGTFVGMILLSFIATRARNIEALSVPEIIGRRFGNTARLLAVIALVIAYMVIVSYQFNAGGMVLEVIAGKKEKVALDVGDSLTKNQVRKGYFHYAPPQDWTGTTEIKFHVKVRGVHEWSERPEIFTVKVVKSTEIISEKARTSRLQNTSAIKENTFTRVIIKGYDSGFKKSDGIYRLAEIPKQGQIYLHEPVLTAVIVMIFLALLVEELIIAEAWFAGSMTPDPENGRYILIYAARHFMPLAMGIIFMITVVGIIISTADSFLLVPATTFIKDIYQNYINPRASEKKIIFMSRLMVLTFGIIAWLVSRVFSESTTVFEKALYAFTVYGSAITPCLVAALFWKRATKAGAISSILAGAVTTLLWEEVIKVHLSEELAKLDAVLPAITLSVICLIVVSLLTTNKEQTVEGQRHS